MIRKSLSAALVAAAICATSSFPSQAATFGTYGDAINNGSSFDLTSYASSGKGYSGIYIEPTALTLGGITQLSSDYNMLAGAFLGGAPRFSIGDTSGKEVWAYWGTLTGGGSSTNPNPNGTQGSTGNYADLSSSDLRFYSNGFGGLNSPNTGLTWSQLVADVGSTAIWYISLDLDGGFKGDQHLLVNNFAVNGEVFSAAAPTPLPAALPLFATGLGALGWLARRRKRKAAVLAAA